MKLKELFEGTTNVIPHWKIRKDSIDVKNGLLRLDHSDDILDGNCTAEDNPLVSLKGFYKKVTRNLDLEGCKDLKTLEFCPSEVGGEFDLGYCDFDTLEFAPKKVGSVILRGCDNLRSLKGIGKDYFQEIGGEIYLSSYIKSNILGLLKIENLEDIEVPPNCIPELKKAVKIISKHLKSDRNIRKCKSELEEAGLGVFAKL